MHPEGTRTNLQKELDTSYGTLCSWFMKQAMIAWYISFALLGLLLLTNLGWWCVWSSYDHVIVEETEFVIEQDSEGMNVITNCFNDERSKDGTEDNKKD